MVYSLATHQSRHWRWTNKRQGQSPHPSYGGSYQALLPSGFQWCCPHHHRHPLCPIRGHLPGRHPLLPHHQPLHCLRPHLRHLRHHFLLPLRLSRLHIPHTRLCPRGEHPPTPQQHQSRGRKQWFLRHLSPIVDPAALPQHQIKGRRQWFSRHLSTSL